MFLVNVPLGVVGLLLSAAILLIVLPLVIGRAEGWPAWTWLCLAAAAPAFAAPVAVTPAHASDFSGVSTTTTQIGGALGVAGFGTLYLSHASSATHAFALVTAALGAAAPVGAAAEAASLRTPSRRTAVRPSS